VTPELVSRSTAMGPRPKLDRDPGLTAKICETEMPDKRKQIVMQDSKSKRELQARVS
jgi:hypothetical protein